MRRFKDRVVVAEIGARSETESADKTGAQIAYDVAEHVFGYEHRIILRILEHPHTNRVDVRVVGADIGIILGDILEATHHQAAGLAQHIRLFDQRDAFATGFLGELECLFADVSATLLAHDASGERDVFQSRFVFPLLHFRVCAQRGVNRFWQRKKFHAAVHALGVFSEHDLIDRHIFAAWIRDLVAAEIERVAGITFTRPHVGVEIEHLTQPDDRRKINQSFVFQFRRQFFLRFRLRFARDGAEKTASCFLQAL